MSSQHHAPTAVDDLSDDELRAWVRFNFIVSADGAATMAGRAGGLGNPADQRALALLRRPADVLLIGAGTVRSEGYGGELLDEAGRDWRTRAGLPPRPAVALVSGSLDLDPAAPFFTEAPERPLVLTCDAADPARRRALSGVADLRSVGRDRVEPSLVVAELASKGLRDIHSEGGPMLFEAFAREGLVDELCLSISPLLVGGGLRILPAALAAPSRMRLQHVLDADGLLLLRYLLRERPS